jgi:ribosome maturation protein SDO1
MSLPIILSRMPDSKITVVRLTLEGNRFEILVKPDPALDFKLGKRTDLSSVLVSDEIYSDSNKGSRAGNEKLTKYFKTTDSIEISRQILLKGELSLTTDQRRRMVEEKRKQIVQYINKSFVDPRTHAPHPPTRIESAMDEVRITIDPFKRAEDQTKMIVEAIRKTIPLKSETLVLSITVPAQSAAHTFSVLKGAGNLKDQQWLSDGSLRAVLEINAGLKGILLEKIAYATKGTAKITEE